MRAGRPDPRWSVLSAVGCVALPCVALRFPVILSIENHCSVQQQRKIAQYLKAIFRDKLDLSSVDTGDSKQLPSPQSLRGKILVKGKKLPYHLGDDAEEGDVSDEDSADEIEDECKFRLHCGQILSSLNLGKTQIVAGSVAVFDDVNRRQLVSCSSPTTRPVTSGTHRAGSTSPGCPPSLRKRAWGWRVSRLFQTWDSWLNL